MTSIENFPAKIEFSRETLTAIMDCIKAINGVPDHPSKVVDGKMVKVTVDSEELCQKIEESTKKINSQRILAVKNIDQLKSILNGSREILNSTEKFVVAEAERKIANRRLAVKAYRDTILAKEEALRREEKMRAEEEQAKAQRIEAQRMEAERMVTTANSPLLGHNNPPVETEAASEFNAKPETPRSLAVLPDPPVASLPRAVAVREYMVGENIPSVEKIDYLRGSAKSTATRTNRFDIEIVSPAEAFRFLLEKNPGSFHADVTELILKHMKTHLKATLETGGNADSIPGIKVKFVSEVKYG